MPKLNVTAAYPTAEELIASGIRTDLVILELQRADKCVDEVRAGLEGLQQAVRAGYRVCVYTQEARTFIHAACLASGARGVVSRGEPLSVAQQAFLDVAGGHTIVTQGIINAFDLLPRRRQLTVVTPTQRTIVGARARQDSFAEIAARLEIPLPAVMDEWHRACEAVSGYLQEVCLEVATEILGLVPDELGDVWPQPTLRRAPRTDEPQASELPELA